VRGGCNRCSMQNACHNPKWVGEVTVKPYEMPIKSTGTVPVAGRVGCKMHALGSLRVFL